MIQKIAYSSIIDAPAIKKFDCGNLRLNQFFYDEAFETESSGFGNTTIFYDDENNVIIGFYTLSLRSLDVAEYSLYQRFQDVYYTNYISQFVARFKQEKFPTLEILRLGVNEAHQKKKYGTAMILELYKDIIDLRLKYNLPVNNIYIDALYEVTEFYEALGFEFITSTDSENQLVTYPMMITLDKIMTIVSEGTG